MICLIKFIIFCLINSIHSGHQCLRNPCINGICIDDVNSTYTCYCQNGFTGIHCETNWNECWSSPCQNNGICTDGIGSFTCTCPETYSGTICEVDLNQCASSPCQNNATCINTYGSFLCKCLKGFSGPLCNIDDPVCNTSPIKCANNATCIEGFGDQFSCICQPGWTGPICNIAIDMCDQYPCLNGGLCINYQTYYMCACAFGFYGKTCDQNLTFCDEPNQCQNNALCLSENDNETITCYCIPDYFGQFCQFQYNDCQFNNTCQNNGICIDGINSISCQCPDNYTGQFCEINISNSSLSETFSFSGSNPSGLSSFLQITLPFSQFQEITIQFKFCLLNNWDQISLILFMGNDKHNIQTDHIAVTYVQGYLMLTWSIGYGPRRIFIKNPLKEPEEFRKNHKLFLQINHNSGLLIIDDIIRVSDNGISYRNSTTIMKTNSKLYLGGYYSRNFSNLPHDLPKHSGFIGCISDVQINNQRFPIDSSRFVMKNCTMKTYN